MSINIGIVGLGIGGKHLSSLQRIPGAKLTAVADLSPERTAQAAAATGARTYTDWQAMLEGERDLDAVILATPALLRAAPIAAICERKLALFCEKPPSLNMDEATRIRDGIEAAGILNTVGFMYRWAPLAERMRTLVRDRDRLFARIVVAWPVFDWVMSGGAPRSLYSKTACGGPLVEQAIHFIDVLRYITGDEPVAVQAMADLGKIAPLDAESTGGGRDCEETTAYIVRHASGMMAAHIHNWTHREHLLQIQIVGQEFDLTLNLNEGALSLHGRIDGEVIDEKSDADHYFREIEGFVAAVEQRDQNLLRSPYADAYRSLAVCAAATTAVEQGGLVAIG